MLKKTGLFTLLLLLTLFVQGCVSYGNYPKIDKTQTQNEYPDLKYTLSGTKGWGGGAKSLEKTLRLEGNFSSIEKLSAKEDSGLLINAKISAVAPSVGSMVFGYISYISLTTLPFWSTQDGYDITFEVYNDGERLKNYNYSFNRRTFVWMPMVLMVWVNYFTPSEKDGFSAVTRQFLQDAEPVLKSI